ncbi:16S rRNA (guanine527-N7)-methyltransferase [Aliiruegeria haliotis]|uniref:Ribosomal RNA small subunit methyltransferase G n=1 Tax=Aliiruegeria haliotis TaxID=1280846 RepID=A0A2T0RHP3_9RHOB|nr:16S rRNA (guanine(527)-N(7))-methyltransferase RsmG [Aliiruegeria haliotis]PRY20685.1 16S rRNA (guanine527-N7)-methyltransferase [Aliiruegeria haliotis]
MRNPIDSFQRVVGLDVSRETLDRLGHHHDLLRKWNPAINLVSAGSLDDSWTRHIVDSAQVFLARPSDVGHWLDLGTGGGFPGLVCAVLAAEIAPNLRFTFVESDKRKATFLMTVIRETGVQATVATKRIEDLKPQEADILSARALAPLEKLLQFADRHLLTTGTCLFPKGSRSEEEVLQAQANWRFKLVKKPSITDPKATILVVGDIQRD